MQVQRIQDNNINNMQFSGRTFIYDKANVLSSFKKFQIRLWAAKLPSSDTVCIGTRKYRTQNAMSGEKMKIQEFRVDYQGGSNRMDYSDIVKEVRKANPKFSQLSSRKQKKVISNYISNSILNIVKNIVPTEHSQSNTKAVKAEVKNWSALKKTYKNAFVKTADKTEQYFTDLKNRPKVVKNDEPGFLSEFFWKTFYILTSAGKSF